MLYKRNWSLKKTETDDPVTVVAVWTNTVDASHGLKLE